MKKQETDSDPLWYKDAILYQVHVRTFFDSNADGIGDFPGLIEKLDYIQRLGVSVIWLLPFYPSPLRDDGYDIAHYEGVHPSYGTLRDVRTFLREAHERGLRVITELVINHTSDQHPWFQAARRAPKGSSKRDFYVWSDTPERYSDVRIIFNDAEHSNWAWDAEAQAYYWHRFFSHQPDLNFDNPHVLRAVNRVMRFWLDMGVDGLRLDAVPYLVERDGTVCENLPETHDILKQIRREMDQRYDNRLLLAEANQWPADVRPYFGHGDESHMAFHFPLMPRLFMAVKQEDRYPVVDVLRQTPEIPETCQWATFLRNHDELTLEMVTSEERDFMWQQYAADPQMRLNMGIRRRLAPLMENNRLRVELLNSLLFSLPGTPVIYYGDEIGMGDNVYLGDRNGVRTPMQWTGDRNAGFSRADPARLYAPVVMDAVYGYQGLNVEAQERSPFSLLNWMRRLIAVRKQHQTFGRGSLELLEPDNPRVLAYVRAYRGERILCIANLARSVQPVELDLRRYSGQVPIEMLDRTEFPRIGESPYVLTMGPYGFYWFLLVDSDSLTSVARVAAKPAVRGAEAPPALLVGPVWDHMLDSHVRTLLERTHLRPFLMRQRWFTSAACGAESIRLEDWTVLKSGPDPLFLAIVSVRCEDGTEERYALPLSTASGDLAKEVLSAAEHRVVARITGARQGVLYTGLSEPMADLIIASASDRREFKTSDGTLRVEPTPSFAQLMAAPPPAGTRVTLPVGPYNAIALVGDRFAIKLLRRVEEGRHPEVELPRHVMAQGFDRVPRSAATLTYHRQGREPATIGVLQEYLQHQRNAWDHAVEEVGRFLDRAVGRELPAEEAAPQPLEAVMVQRVPALAMDTIAGYLETAATLGRRTAELHAALARPDADGEFGISHADPGYVSSMVANVTSQLHYGLARVKERLPDLNADAAAAARALIETEATLDRQFEELAARAKEGGAAIRVHGDLHLGQILLHQGDALFIDFEGDPARPNGWRRRRHSPLRDVATMVQSFRYAAYAGLLIYASTRPADRARIRQWTEYWHLWSSAAFLRSYTASLDDTKLVAVGTPAFEAGLRLLLADQAMTDLDMELRYRLEWVGVPLETLRRVVAP